ncbi:MAG: glycosyltransferase [Candidatus Binatia bacterium]
MSTPRSDAARDCRRVACSYKRLHRARRGTAGHVTPALAVADGAVRRRWPDARVLLLGSADGLQARLVASHGHAFTPLPAAPWYGVGLPGRLRAVERLIAGRRAARRRCARRRAAGGRVRRLRLRRRRAGARAASPRGAGRGQRAAG